MNIEQMNYIIDVAKTGSLSTSAKNLHMTVSAISQSISSLENELTIKIFKRTRQGAIVTEEGNLIVKKAIDIINNVNDLKELALSHSRQANEELNIISIPGQMKMIIDILKSFKLDYPNLIIKIDEKPTYKIIEDIKNNKADIGILTITNDLIEKENALKFDVLYEGKLMVCVSKCNPLSLNKILNVEDLKNNSFVIYDGIYFKTFFKKHISHVSKVDLLFTTSNIDSIRSAVEADFAITLSYDYAIKFDPIITSGQGVAIDLNNPFESSPNLGWVHSKEKNVSPISKLFINRLQDKLYNT